MGALIVCGRLERATGPGGIFFKDQGHAFAFQKAGFRAVPAGLLEPGRQIDQKMQFRGGKVFNF